MAEVPAGPDRISLIETGLEAQMGLLSPTEQQALNERLAGRFGWGIAGDLAVAENTVFTLDQEDYGYTLAALSALGIEDSIRIPEYEEVVAELAPVAAYLGEHVSRGDKPELTFHIPLTRGYDLRGLVAEFDKRQEHDTSIWPDLWDTLHGDDHNMGETRLRAGMWLNDMTDPANRTRPANLYGEAGLVHIRQNVRQQRASLRAEREGEAEGIDLHAASVTEYMVIQAKRRYQPRDTRKPLDTETYTCFPQYRERQVDADGLAVVPLASAINDDNALSLSATSIDSMDPRSGVRRVVSCLVLRIALVLTLPLVRRRTLLPSRGARPTS